MGHDQKRCYSFPSPSTLLLLQCCFLRPQRQGQEAYVHLDFHAAPELWPILLLPSWCLTSTEATYGLLGTDGLGPYSSEAAFHGRSIQMQVMWRKAGMAGTQRHYLVVRETESQSGTQRYIILSTPGATTSAISPTLYNPPPPTTTTTLQLASQAGRKGVGGGRERGWGWGRSCRGRVHKERNAEATPQNLLISCCVPLADELSTLLPGIDGHRAASWGGKRKGCAAVCYLTALSVWGRAGARAALWYHYLQWLQQLEQPQAYLRRGWGQVQAFERNAGFFHHFVLMARVVMVTTEMPHNFMMVMRMCFGGRMS